MFTIEITDLAIVREDVESSRKMQKNKRDTISALFLLFQIDMPTQTRLISAT